MLRRRRPGLRSFGASARQAGVAAAAYLFITIAMTWPLVRGLARDVPSDLGDPLLNMWILAWDAEQLRAILGGATGRIATFFDANIFYPAPLTLAYSEHLFAQAVQILPIYVATRNPILVYNLLFLSTFVLSGLGAFLLVREITGSPRAGFVAGLLFAIALFRWTHGPHMQVMSAQWMPFTLYGLRRYFTTGQRRALIGAAAALIAQNLSCGYYLLYFMPIAILFALWEIASRNQWRNRHMWLDLLGATAVVILVTAPFLVPYKRVHDHYQLVRDPIEVARFSADVYSYFTASPENRTWGKTARAFPKQEAELFPGAVPILLAVAAIALWTWRAARLPVDRPRRGPRWVIVAAAAIGASYALLAIALVFARRFDLDLGLFTIRATNVTRVLVPPVVAFVVILWALPSARTKVAAAVREPEAIFLLIVVLAWWLSLGPAPRVLGRSLQIWAPYRVLYEYVPGYDGLRVPARMAMIVALGLSVLAGLAAARLDRMRRGAIGLLLVCFVFVIEARTPLGANGVSPGRDYATPEPRVYRPSRAPAVYRELAKTPPDAVVLEMPFGQTDYDVRSVYYSTVHWRRLVNGYSGFFPPHYSRAIAMLNAGDRSDDVTWQALQTLGVTHVVVHEGAYLNEEGVRFSNWLRGHGAAEIFRDGRDVLFELRR